MTPGPNPDHLHRDVAGFARAADAYERGRPGYPPALVGWIAATTGLGPGSVVVDLAAGTGKFTRELVPTGAEVIAVEPVAEMRAQLAGLPVAVRVGTAQATGLDAGSADVVTVAQALHWFATDEALAEIARVLRPSGFLVPVWNRRDTSDPLQAAVTDLIEPYRTGTPSHVTGAWQRVLDGSDRFVFAAEEHLVSEQEVDRDGLVDRVCSISFIARLPKATRAGLAAELVALAPEAEHFSLRYRSEAFVYRRAL